MSHPQMTDYLGGARWFAGKGRHYEVTDVDRVASVHVGDALLTLDVLTVEYEGEGRRDVERYQMPLVHLPVERADLHHALLGRHEGRWTYDAVHDPESMARYLEVFARTEPGGTRQVGGAVFHRLDVEGSSDDGALDPALPARLLTGEQSNTTVVYGDRTLLKLFRQVTPGRNPDIEIHAALTAAGNPTVGALRGWVTAGEGERTEDLAMLQEFLVDAHDGWALTLDAARRGDDFAGEALALGATVASAHHALAEQFPTGTVDGDDLAERMRVRVEAALIGFPQLAPYADGLRQRLDGLGDQGEQEVQRVHGDLHLGQTLLTPSGWRLVDFEGEPAKPLAERRLPDSRWRDVAGMLRSFDYAAHAAGAEPGWATTPRARFLHGYAGRCLTPAEQSLLDAYEVDKAVYEVGYEARNRPDWVDIPLAAVQRIATTPTPKEGPQ
ncbi:maltokinase N-terminal cap-like domain-containing protein [Nocardioides aequoreus]|uniref:maltokinase N-terminal cap-like domain-containing protein n=1 Tax=Nocardioides aequoreus TaxID=397278 RepID=UPI001FDEAAC1|nr:hypothetical protein [Nocardioides aequoreus]